MRLSPCRFRSFCRFRLRTKAQRLVASDALFLTNFAVRATKNMLSKNNKFDRHTVKAGNQKQIEAGRTQSSLSLYSAEERVRRHTHTFAACKFRPPASIFASINQRATLFVDRIFILFFFLLFFCFLFFLLSPSTLLHLVAVWRTAFLYRYLDQMNSTLSCQPHTHSGCRIHQSSNAAKVSRLIFRVQNKTLTNHASHTNGLCLFSNSI